MNTQEQLVKLDYLRAELAKGAEPRELSKHSVSGLLEALNVDADSFAAIINQLDNPTPISKKLQKTLTAASPWDPAQ